MAPTIDVDPTGDVIIILGSKHHEQRLRVSSTALSSISSVWRTMLKSRFLEGQEKDGFRELSLPEDDPEAVIVLCNIAHFRSDKVKLSSFSLFEQLAILCDKYDTAQAVMPWSTIGFIDQFNPIFLRLRGNESHVHRLLHMAFAFNNEKAFAMVSKDLLFKSTSTVLANIDSDGSVYPLLPSGFLDEVTVYHEVCMMKILHSVEEALSPILKEIARDRQANDSPKFYFSNAFPSPSSTRSLFGVPSPTVPKSPLSSLFQNHRTSSDFEAGPSAAGSSAAGQSIPAPLNKRKRRPTPLLEQASSLPARLVEVSDTSTRLSNVMNHPSRPSGSRSIFADTAPALPHGQPATNALPSPSSTTPTLPPGPTSATRSGQPNIFMNNSAKGKSPSQDAGNTTSPSVLNPLNPSIYCRREQFLGSWLLEMTRAGLWPTLTAVRESSIDSIYYKLNAIRDDAAVTGGNRLGCPCCVCSSSLQQLMRGVALETPVGSHHLCLICVKAGKFTPLNGNCGGSIHGQEVWIDLESERPDRTD